MLSSAGGTSASATAASSTSTKAPTPFRGAPCITSLDRSSLEVFAHDGTRVYRSLISGEISIPWTIVENLDASLLEVDAELDCSGSNGALHLVGTARSPVGGLLHAATVQTVFQAFKLESIVSSGTLNANPTIAGTTGTKLVIAATEENHIVAGTLPSAGFQAYPQPARTDIASGLDGALRTNSNATLSQFAAFTTQGTLVVVSYVQGPTSSWMASSELVAPNSLQYSHSPSVCVGYIPDPNPKIAVSSPRAYLAAVVEGQLWFAAETPENSQLFQRWSLVSDDAASAPDCVITQNTELRTVNINIVVRNSKGGITVHQGLQEGQSFRAVDLGTVP